MPLPKTLRRLATAATPYLLPALLAAQDSVVVRGRVIDARTQAPVAGAAVALTAGRDTVAGARADEAGYFAASVRAGAGARVVAHFLRVGYRTDSLALDSLTPVFVAMAPLGTAAVALRATRVTAPAGTAVAERARRAGGAYVGEAEIARRGPARTADLFRGVVGITVQDDGGRTRIASSRRVEPRRAGPTRAPSAASADTAGDPLEGLKLPGGGTACALRVSLDGQLMPDDFSVDDVPVSDVAEIEIYRGAATVPVELSAVRTAAKCGAIVIWTKRGGRRAR
ncbi:hypothetical protein J421_5409 (plasmid) [Gemmatirosa kalamazoonensis]|uniref:TonB-dependent receptor plug n=1 Tax=Gemmatirosa kalamazoonensis TaxID=861299 RepID=W0RPL4_9BACT|nr:hypothetical protein [Gemmatirosa kalamazoonensis]AHG92944.1 hypothetical protein J421_5409 [Gemmatirosa kalamazoonensis]